MSRLGRYQNGVSAPHLFALDSDRTADIQDRQLRAIKATSNLTVCLILHRRARGASVTFACQLYA